MNIEYKDIHDFGCDEIDDDIMFSANPIVKPCMG